MSIEPFAASGATDALVLVDGLAPGMPLGPTLRFTQPPFHVSVFGGARRPQDPDWAQAPIVDIADLPAVVRAEIERSIAEHVGDESWPARRPPWFRKGWLQQVEDWIDDQLRVLNLVRGADPVPVRVWSLSAVLRLPLTDGADFWFKASCDQFRAEPAVTRAIGALAGSTAPGVLASDDDRAWLLLAPLPPTTVDPVGRIEATLAFPISCPWLEAMSGLPVRA